MTNTQDHNPIPLNAVADDVRGDEDQLAHGSAAHWPPSMWEIHQAVAGRHESVGHALCRTWIELIDVFVGARYAPQGGFRPNDLHALRFGRRNLLALC